MGIAFNGEFTVPTSPDKVIDAFADLPRMASLMPGAFLEGKDEDGAWRGGMMVAFGPKKIKFNGKVTLEIDRAARSGTMVGRGTADMRAARVETKLRFDVKEAGGESVVALTSDTAMTGVLAEFARTGGPAVARVLMEQFAQRLRAELAPAPPAASAPPAAQELPAPPPRPTSLRIDALLWSVLRQWIRRLTRRG